MTTSYAHLQHASRTDVGLKREHNEDAHTEVPELGVFVVADGMGGGEAGEVASQLTVSAVREALAPVSDQPGINNLKVKARALGLAANQACRAIRAYVAQRGFSRSGSTFASLVFDVNQPGHALALHAGDSRVYRYRKGKLDRVTRDHSVAGEVGITNEDKIPAMFVGVITRAVGILDSVELEETPVDVKPGDIFVLCSDGLSNMVPDAQLLRHLKGRLDESLDDLAALLIREANAAGGKDNITVQLVEVLEHPVFQQPPAELALPPGFDAEDTGDPATATTGKTGSSAENSTSSPAFSLRHELDQEKTAATSPASPAAPPAPAAAAARMTFDELSRIAGPVSPAPPARPAVPAKAWIAIAVLVLILVLLLLLPGREPEDGAPVKSPGTGAPPPVVPAAGTPSAPAEPPAEPAPPEPAQPGEDPVSKPAPPPAPKDPPAPDKPVVPDSGLAAALSAMEDLKKTVPAAPTNVAAQTGGDAAVMPKPPVEPPPPPPPPPVPAEPPKPTASVVAAAARAALTNGLWSVFADLDSRAGEGARSDLSAGESAAVDAWMGVWREATGQTEITGWFDTVFNLEDEWREFLPQLQGPALVAPTNLNADAYCRVLVEFSTRAPERARQARGTLESLGRVFGKADGASLANFRKFHGRALAADGAAALDGRWPDLAAGADLLRQVAELPAGRPLPRALLLGLSELKLRERSLLTVNMVSVIVRHVVQKGDVVVQQHKNVLIGHGLQQSPGMVLLDEVADRVGAVARAARGAEITPEWVAANGEAVSRLLASTDRFMKWQAEQAAP